jgi:hypothetical protein
VIGSRKKLVSRGKRKGQITSETDTPAERARKWTAFQAGQFDVVLLTYTALGRTRMNEDALRAYAEQTEAIRREVKLRQRNARGAKRLTERQQAVLKEGVAAWIAEKLEIPEGWDYDPGIAWDELGIDLLIIDEAQNFKFGRSDQDSMISARYRAGRSAIRRHFCPILAQCAQPRARRPAPGILCLNSSPGPATASAAGPNPSTALPGPPRSLLPSATKCAPVPDGRADRMIIELWGWVRGL